MGNSNEAMDTKRQEAVDKVRKMVTEGKSLAEACEEVGVEKGEARKIREFELGRLVVTRGIDDKMDEDLGFRRFVEVSIGRYIDCDWGDTCEEDKASNDEAVAKGERILAVYKRRDDTIWIITEWDRSVTTILFPEEH